MAIYTYTFSQFPNTTVNSSSLTAEILSSSINNSLTGINCNFSTQICEIDFVGSLDGTEVTTLGTIVANHTGAEPVVTTSPTFTDTGDIDLPVGGQITIGGNPLSKSDVGLGNVDNTSDINKPVSTATQTALNGKASTTDLTTHTGNTSNPHSTTKTQVGLGNVDNTSDVNKPISTATQTALNLKADSSALTSHTGNTNNPHSTTKAQIGLGNVDNTSDANKPISTATQTALNLKADTTALTSHTGNTSNPHSVTKAQVGLGNVDNTSDINKPLSTAVQTALNLKLDASLKGAVNGIAELDASGKIITSQIPAAIDDVLEYANYASLPTTGTAGKIYVTLDDNKTYRWGGTTYVVISDTIALGETSSTAYRGDRGKTAYDHSIIVSGNPHGTTASHVGAEPANPNIQTHIGRVDNPHATTKVQVGLSNVDNTSDINKPVSTAMQTALNLKADSSSLTSHTGNTSNPHATTKAQVGLGNVDNTSDANKPVSTATQTALNLKLDASLKGAVNGVAELDSSGKILTSQIPSSIDDVLEYANFSSLPVTGVSGKIYVTIDDNKTYRWGGSVYVVISDTIALGETASTAYRGDRGKTAYEHSQVISGNPHGTTATQVGAEPANVNIQSHISSTSNPHSVTKSQVGLGNVDNTSDVNKPVSTATQTALNLKLNTSLKGAVNGLAELDSTGKIPTAQLPSYVDDVIEFANLASFPVTGESGKIYIAIDTNITYRWSGTVYVSMASSLALGETSSTAYRGDRGKTAYDHSQITTGNPHGTTASSIGAEPANANIQSHISSTSNPHSVTKTQVGLSNVDNTSDIDKPVSTAQQTALNLKANSVDLTSHTGNTSNPHATTKTQVGLGNVDNTSDVNKPISTATQTALNLKADSSALTSHTGNTSNPHSTTATQVGLGNVLNVAQIPASEKGQPNGVATLDATGKVPASQLDLPVFGTGYSDAEDASETSTTGTTLVTKVTLSYTPPTTGKYRFGSYCEVRTSAANRAIRTLFSFNLGDLSDCTSYITSTTERRPIYTHDFWTLTGGTTYTITLQFTRVGSSATVYIKNARIEVWRVS